MVEVCCVCHQSKEARMSVTVDEGTHHYCEACWRVQQQKFLRALESGDAKAQRILQAVTLAAWKANRGDKLQ